MTVFPESRTSGTSGAVFDLLPDGGDPADRFQEALFGELLPWLLHGQEPPDPPEADRPPPVAPSACPLCKDLPGQLHVWRQVNDRDPDRRLPEVVEGFEVVSGPSHTSITVG